MHVTTVRSFAMQCSPNIESGNVLLHNLTHTISAMRFAKPVISRTSRTVLVAPLIVFAIGLAGCDPVINIAGANFPAWLFCAICGVVITALIRTLFVVTRVEPVLWPLPIVYPCLMVLTGCIVWLIFFNRI
jgi:YtcA-like protein